MNESIHKYFKVGTIQWMSYPNRDPMESLKAIARDDFFDAVEVKGFGPDNQKAKAILEQSHLKVCYGAQPRLLGPKLNPNAVDEAERQKAEATLIEAVDEAQLLGAGGIAFLASENHPKPLHLRGLQGDDGRAGGLRLRHGQGRAHRPRPLCRPVRRRYAHNP